MNANPELLSLQAFQSGAHENARLRRKARLSLVANLKRKASAEHAYRKGLSISYAKYRNAGKGAGESEIHAKADAADAAMRRDMADASAKGAAARVAELEGERASLRQLAEWSRDVG